MTRITSIAGIFLCCALKAQSEVPAIDPALERALAQQASVRVVVALRPIFDTAATSRSEENVELSRRQVLASRMRHSVAASVTRTLRDLDLSRTQIHARYEYLPALIASIGAADLARLRTNPAVAGIELDSGGFGLLVAAQPVSKLGRVAILDTGLPTDTAGIDPSKLRNEFCFCRHLNGAGCCPNGASVQDGADSARDSMAFATSTQHWLASPLAPDALVPSHAPYITAAKVLSREDRFETWENIFSALERLIFMEESLNYVVFSFASSQLYREQDCSGLSATAWILQYATRLLLEQGVTPMVALAAGGPGPAGLCPVAWAATQARSGSMLR